MERTAPRRLAGRYLANRQGTARLKTAVTLAASALDFPDAQINVLDDHHQHTISELSGDEPHSIPRAHSLCQFVVDAALPMVVGDVRADPRFAALPGVAAGLVGSYVGVPLAVRGSAPFGTLCVHDSQPRRIPSGDVDRLNQFVHIVNGHLDLMRSRSEDELDRLTAAVANDEIVPWYQPIVNVRTGAVAAYEALARWQQPDGTIVAAAELLPVARNSDLVLELDRAVMRRAFADAARARRSSPTLRVSVNISNRHLDIPGAVREICYATIDSGLPPSAIDLEMTETEDFGDEDEARRAVGLLRGYGFGVILDDFGSGWQSLDWVLRLPVSGFKLNRGAAAALGTPVGDALARALAGLSAEAGLDAIVDGISTAQQAELVRMLGYRHAQGELWSSPGPTLGVSALSP